MKRALIAQISIAILLVLGLAFLAINADAFMTYSTSGGATGNCADCHGSFIVGPTPYVSLHDGVQWKNPTTGTALNIHDGHRLYMLNSDCNVCHTGTTRTPVYLSSSNGGTGFQALSCLGCHGRAESASGGAVTGAGLRQHHYRSGVTVCTGCHGDANPAGFTTAAENVAPPYYFTPDAAHPNKPNDPCNLNGSESAVAPTVGLDKDGNLLYGAADPACKPAPPANVSVPNVVGMTQAAASSAITGAGLTVGTVTTQGSSTVASGNVISESPAAGASVASGSAVNLVVSSGPAMVTVPNVVGMTQTSATTALTNAGLSGAVTTQSSSTVPAGQVISQNPAAGTSVATGSIVNLVVSSGQASVSVPNVVGMTQAVAGTAITGAGLTVGTVTTQSSSTVASGNVISESPAAGTSVAAGSAVNLVVSSGPAPVTVPNVVGMTQAAATTAITGAGLKVGTVTTQSSSTMASGNVISESPAAGASVASGSAVNLVVSSGPTPPANVTVPNVVGMTQAAATTAITGAGLKVGTVTTQSSSTVASGNVISHNPAAGASVASGSSVNLVVSSGSGTLDGAALYSANCASCHGPLATSQVRGESASDIQEAINEVRQMAGLKYLTSAQIQAIAGALKGSAPTAGPDVALTKLAAPSQVSARVGSSVSVFSGMIAASASTNTSGTSAKVTLTSSAGGGVSVSIGTASVTKTIDTTATFPFSARITCTRSGTWPVTWTATISSSRNSNTANDVQTATTNVVCSGESSDD